MRIEEIPLSRASDCVPLQQSPGYGRVLRRLGARVRRVELWEGGKPQGQVLLIGRGWGRLGITVAIRGPVWRGDSDAAMRARLLAGLARTTGPLVAPGEGGMRIAGSRDLAILPLLAPDEQRRSLSQSWRNRLRKGEASAVRIEAVCPTPADLDWILAADATQQRARGYRALPGRFLHAWAACNPRDMRLYRAWRGDDLVAGALFLLHHPWASYHIAVSSGAARATEAHRLILWQAMLDLRTAGYSMLDLGAAEAGAPGLAAFKRGTGARVEPTGPSGLLLPFRLPRFGSPVASVPAWHRKGGT